MEAVRLGTDEQATISLTVPAKAEYVIVCRLALDGLADTATFPPEVLSDLKLAVTEACANSIAHAYPGEAGLIRVDVSREPERVLVEIADDGVGIGEHEIGSFEQEPEIGEGLHEGGMGLALISALVDELQVGTRPGGRGTRVAFSKSLA